MEGKFIFLFVTHGKDDLHTTCTDFPHFTEDEYALEVKAALGGIDRYWCLYSSIQVQLSHMTPRKLKESVTGSTVDVAVMPGTSQRYYEDSLQDFASSGHAGVSKTGPGERKSSRSQVDRIHTGEHQYVYVAMWHPNQSAIRLDITRSDNSRVWKDLTTQKKPCREFSIRLAQGWGNYPVPTVRSEYT
jgi:hypothetical protein